MSIKEMNMTTRYLMTVGAALVLGAAFIAGPVSAASTTGEKTPINDSWLTSKTKIALFADARVKGRQIDVETTQGQVMLRGKVDSTEAKQAAEGITKGIEGVKSVKNDLEIVAPVKREAVDDKDDAITTRVKEYVAKEPALKNAHISVQTNAGVVSLTGDAPDLTTSAQASWTAWIVPGVKSVKNDLTLQEKS